MCYNMHIGGDRVLSDDEQRAFLDDVSANIAVHKSDIAIGIFRDADSGDYFIAGAMTGEGNPDLANTLDALTNVLLGCFDQIGVPQDIIKRMVDSVTRGVKWINKHQSEIRGRVIEQAYAGGIRKS